MNRLYNESIVKLLCLPQRLVTAFGPESLGTTFVTDFLKAINGLVFYSSGDESNL